MGSGQRISPTSLEVDESYSDNECIQNALIRWMKRKVDLSLISVSHIGAKCLGYVWLNC